MEKVNKIDILKYIFEFHVVSFLILGGAELLKPHLVTSLIRLDYHFLMMLIFGIIYFSLSDR